MKNLIIILTVLFSLSAFAQHSEIAADSTLVLKRELAHPKLNILSSKPNFVASSISLLDESGQETDVITSELLIQMQQEGKLPTIRIGNVVFVIKAPDFQREEYMRSQE